MKNITISVTNDGGLADPPPVVYAVTFDPSTIAGLQGWWKADSIVGLSDGAQLVTWDDSSGNNKTITGGCSAVGGAAPYYRATGFNGKPCLDFPYLGCACEIANGGVGQNAPWTEFVVLKATPPTFYTLAMSGGWGSSGLGINAGGYIWAANGVQYNAGAPDTSPHVAVAVIDSTNASFVNNRLFVDGNQFVSRIAGSGQDFTSFDRLGAYAGGNFGVGLVAEILHYNVALSDADRQKVQNYLADKYVITFPPPFNPSQIAGLKGWWAADSLALADGTPVDSLQDQSGHTNTATATGATRPVMATNAAGKRVIRFDSTSQSYLSLATALPDTTWTILVVMKPLNSGSILASIGSITAYGTCGPHFWAGFQHQLDCAGVGYLYTPDGDDAFHVLTGASTAEMFRDGVALTKGAGTAFGGGAFDMFGRRYVQTSDGDIAEILFYDSVLSVSDRVKAENYLRLKYGI